LGCGDFQVTRTEGSYVFDAHGSVTSISWRDGQVQKAAIETGEMMARQKEAVDMSALQRLRLETNLID
jgi:hypothetical protein